MDPLSITVGILAILGAGGKVGDGLRKILALKHAPEAVMALNNEVNEIHRIVQNIDDVLQRHARTPGSLTISSLVDTLVQTKMTALDVEKLIAYELTVVKADGQSTRIDRSKWLRSKERIQKLKERIQLNKASLSIGLSVLTS